MLKYIYIDIDIYTVYIDSDILTCYDFFGIYYLCVCVCVCVCVWVWGLCLCVCVHMISLVDEFDYITAKLNNWSTNLY